MPKRDEHSAERQAQSAEKETEEQSAERQAPSAMRTAKGSKPPHGGKWVYDKDRDELTLAEEPTKER